MLTLLAVCCYLLLCCLAIPLLLTGVIFGIVGWLLGAWQEVEEELWCGWFGLILTALSVAGLAAVTR